MELEIPVGTRRLLACLAACGALAILGLTAQAKLDRDDKPVAAHAPFEFNANRLEASP